MDNFGNIITSLDIFSLKTHFTINEKGDTRYKNFYGGILSLIFFFISLIFIHYFIFRLLGQKDLNVMYSVENDKFLSISYSYKLPFMVRLSDNHRIPLNKDKLYNITLKVFYNVYNETLDDYTINEFDEIILEECNINKHFGEYKKYFEDIKNINSFYCPLERNSNQILYGAYGENANFSFYYYYFSKCSNNNCYIEEEIKNILSEAYLDLIFVDYSINNLNSKEPKKLIVRSERFLISSTIYKRIWLYFKQVKYINDNGYILTKKNEEKFHQFHSLRFDSDYRDIEHSDEPSTFLTMCIANSGEVSVFNRKNLKFQDYLANICGVIKTLKVLFGILNYHFAKNTYLIRIIKDFLIENSLEKKSINRKSVGFDFISLNNSDINMIKKSSGLNSSNLKKKLEEKELIEKKFKCKFLPIRMIFRKQSEVETIEKLIKTINNRLNIIGILNKLEIIENLKKDNQNIQSYLLNNSNYFHNIEWKDKETNASFYSKKYNNYMSFEERKIKSPNLKANKNKLASKFFTPK